MIKKLLCEIESLAPDAAAIFKDIAESSFDGEGYTRPAYGEEETRAGDRLRDFASEQGIASRTDLVGNYEFILPGEEPLPKAVVMASHLDSVPVGGNYDGLAGVVAGVLVQAACKRSGVTPPHALKTVGFRCEESPWFGSAYIGSRLALGMISDEELESLTRVDTKKTLATHLQEIGALFNEKEIYSNRLRRESIAAYLELHIEQGPLLDDLEIPVGIATAIRGNIRHPFATCRGRYAHAAASPRHLRSDAVIATAQLAVAADRLWAKFISDGNNDDLIINFGIFSTDAKQHAMTKVAGEVQFSLNIGGTNNEVMETLHERILREAKVIGDECRVEFNFGERVGTDGVQLNSNLVEVAKRTAADVGVTARLLPTVGHDAAMFAKLGIPACVYLVRNQNGSHNPKEDMRLNDFIEGTKVLALSAIRRYR